MAVKTRNKQSESKTKNELYLAKAKPSAHPRWTRLPMFGSSASLRSFFSFFFHSLGHDRTPIFAGLREAHHPESHGYWRPLTHFCQGGLQDFDWNFFSFFFVILEGDLLHWLWSGPHNISATSQVMMVGPARGEGVIHWAPGFYPVTAVNGSPLVLA